MMWIKPRPTTPKPDICPPPQKITVPYRVGLFPARPNSITKEDLEYALACMGRSEAKQCADCHTTYSHSELWLFADYGFVCAACIEKRLKKKGAE